MGSCVSISKNVCDSIATGVWVMDMIKARQDDDGVVMGVVTGSGDVEMR